MTTRNRVVNNQDVIARHISNIFNPSRAEAVGDDDTGDGVQTGEIWINNDAQNIHDHVFAVANRDFIPN